MSLINTIANMLNDISPYVMAGMGEATIKQILRSIASQITPEQLAVVAANRVSLLDDLHQGVLAKLPNIPLPEVNTELVLKLLQQVSEPHFNALVDTPGGQGWLASQLAELAQLMGKG